MSTPDDPPSEQASMQIGSSLASSLQEETTVGLDEEHANRCATSNMCSQSDVVASRTRFHGSNQADYLRAQDQGYQCSISSCFFQTKKDLQLPTFSEQFQAFTDAVGEGIACSPIGESHALSADMVGLDKFLPEASATSNLLETERSVYTEQPVSMLSLPEKILKQSLFERSINYQPLMTVVSTGPSSTTACTLKGWHAFPPDGGPQSPPDGLQLMDIPIIQDYKELQSRLLLDEGDLEDGSDELEELSGAVLLQELLGQVEMADSVAKQDGMDSQEPHLESESLFYEPPKFPRLDVLFANYDLMSSGIVQQQAYSPLGVRQMFMSAANSFTPPNCPWDTEPCGTSPQAILRSAAKSFGGTPSIVRKRQREAITPVQQPAFSEGLDSGMSKQAGSIKSRLLEVNELSWTPLLKVASYDDESGLGLCSALKLSAERLLHVSPPYCLKTKVPLALKFDTNQFEFTSPVSQNRLQVLSECDKRGSPKFVKSKPWLETGKDKVRSEETGQSEKSIRLRLNEIKKEVQLNFVCFGLSRIIKKDVFVVCYGLLSDYLSLLKLPLVLQTVM